MGSIRVKNECSIIGDSIVGRHIEVCHKCVKLLYSREFPWLRMTGLLKLERKHMRRGQ